MHIASSPSGRQPRRGDRDQRQRQRQTGQLARAEELHAPDGRRRSHGGKRVTVRPRRYKFTLTPVVIKTFLSVHRRRDDSDIGFSPLLCQRSHRPNRSLLERSVANVGEPRHHRGSTEWVAASAGSEEAIAVAWRDQVEHPPHIARRSRHRPVSADRLWPRRLPFTAASPNAIDGRQHLRDDRLERVAVAPARRAPSSAVERRRASRARIMLVSAHLGENVQLVGASKPCRSTRHAARFAATFRHAAPRRDCDARIGQQSASSRRAWRRAGPRRTRRGDRSRSCARASRRRGGARCHRRVRDGAAWGVGPTPD